MPPFKDEAFDHRTERRLIIVGSVFLLISLIDFLGGFVFYPLQISITLLSEQRRSGREQSRVDQVTESYKKGNAYLAMFNVKEGRLWKS